MGDAPPFVRVSGCLTFLLALLAQLVDAAGLNPAGSGFDSQGGHRVSGASRDRCKAFLLPSWRNLADAAASRAVCSGFESRGGHTTIGHG